MDPREPDHTRLTPETPEGAYPYHPLIDDWKAAHFFGYTHEDIVQRTDRRWLRQIIRIEEIFGKIQYDLAKSPTLDDDEPSPGVKPVYDKDKGGFLAGGQPQQQGPQSPVEEFASFVNKPKTVTSIAELRAAARQALEESGG